MDDLLMTTMLRVLGRTGDWRRGSMHCAGHVAAGTFKVVCAVRPGSACSGWPSGGDLQTLV